MTEQNKSHEHKLSTVSLFSKKYPAFPEGGLRFIIFHAETNGFAKCILRVGRKVLIDEDMFFQIIEEQNVQAEGVK